MSQTIFRVDSAPTPDRQIAMVIDLNKCMGCQTCTVACKNLWTSGEGQEHMWWNKVNTMPGEGSPRGWEEMGGGFDGAGIPIALWRLFGGRMNQSTLPATEDFGEYVTLPFDEAVNSGDERIPTAPENRPKWMFNWDEDRGAGEYPNSFFFYLPRLCNHCTRPACLEACPRDAIYKRQEDGIVLVDEEDCNGYRFCVEACPYKVIYFNAEESSIGLGAKPEGVDTAAGIAQKCIGCYPRIERGVAPACVRQCPGRARFYGFLDDEGTPVHELVEEWEVALPLHPEFNTEPNVYYVPPMSSPRLDDDGRYTEETRIPRAYLRELFGDQVDDALETLQREREKAREGRDSSLMDHLIGWRWPDDFFGEFTTHPTDAKSPQGTEQTEENPVDSGNRATQR